METSKDRSSLLKFCLPHAPPHTHLIRNLPLGSSVHGELEGKVHINISNAQDSQSHQVLSTAGPKVLENISKLRRMIWVRVESLLPWQRVVLGFHGALSSLASW